MFDHDLVRFPLLGEHANLECDSCHQSKKFTEADTACSSCHIEDDPHAGRYDDDCQTCHNPVAWDLWLFDHNTQSNFVLDGAHTAVACDACHSTSLTSMSNKGDSCETCHRDDDVHNGEFGRDCGRCHSNQDFGVVRSLQ